MPTFSRIFIGIIVCHASFASAVRAQPVASDYGVRAAQAAAGPVLVLNVQHQSSDTLLVQLEAAGTLFDRMLYEPWWPSRGTTRLSREEGGRAVARAAWVSYPQVGQKLLSWSSTFGVPIELTTRRASDLSTMLQRLDPLPADAAARHSCSWALFMGAGPGAGLPWSANTQVQRREC